MYHSTKRINTALDDADQNPYAMVVAGDVLVGNFDNKTDLQGTGSTTVNYHLDTKQMTLLATTPRDLKECLSGIGLLIAMTMLWFGWAVVGSTPGDGDTTDIKSAGWLIVLDSQGKSSPLSGVRISVPP